MTREERDTLPDDGLTVMLGPLDVTLAEDTVVEPDLLVARRDAFTAKDPRPRRCWPSRCSPRAPAAMT